MSQLHLVGDAIELDGVTVGTLVPGLRLSIRDLLEEIFDAADEEYIAELEDLLERRETRIAALENERLKAPAR
jgi:hypothetical protein